MAFRVGDIISAADLNAFVNDLNNNLLGTGSGTTGYGQTLLSTVTPGQVVSASQWRDLRNAINTAAIHQGTAVSVPPLTELDPGDDVEAFESLDGKPYDIDSSVAAVITNRLNSDPGQRSTIAIGTATRSSAWSSTINATVRVQFASEDDARYFFNTGGVIEFDGDHPNSGSQPNQDDAWRDILDTYVGELQLTYNTFSRSGSRGSATSVGYYGLGTSFTTVYNGTNIGNGAYSSNDVTVQARVLNVVGTNGGNGDAIEFQITLSDDHPSISGSYDTVASGTNFDFRVQKASQYTIGTPTFTVSNSF
jgi:hypothetical protein